MSCISSVVDKSIKSVRWESIKIHLAIWFEAIKREVESPNLWGELEKEKEISNAASVSDQHNTQFINPELNRIHSSIETIYYHLKKSLLLYENQDKFIRQRLDYLTEASKRLGKKDWINLTLGVLMNLIRFLHLTSNLAGRINQSCRQ